MCLHAPRAAEAQLAAPRSSGAVKPDTTDQDKKVGAEYAGLEGAEYVGLEALTRHPT